MSGICIFCGRKTDDRGICTNTNCPDYKRKQIIEKDRMKRETEEASKK